MVDWARAVPAVGVAAFVAWPLSNYVRKEHAEAAAAGFLQDVRAAQQAFRTTGGGGGYASELASLITPCEGQRVAVLPADRLTLVANAGYEVNVRRAENAEPRGHDCHGRPTVGDYYASAQPRSADVQAQQAFATMASSARVFVFFDGVAPLERDMRPGGLATPLEDLATFKIP